MIWLRGCSGHPFLYQKELSSALEEAGQLLGNWGRRETLEHPLWSTTNKRARRRNYICTEAHRNSAVYDGPNLNTIHKPEIARTRVRKRRIQEFTLWQENKLYGPQSRWKTFNSQREDLEAFFMCAAIVVQIESWWDQGIYLQDISMQFVKNSWKKFGFFLEIFVLVIFLLSWNIMNWSIYMSCFTIIRSKS